jgi:hypothetical protein
MCLHVVITRQIEGLTHGMNVSVCEERPNVSLKARSVLSFPSPKWDGPAFVDGLVFRINSKVELLPLWHIEQERSFHCAAGAFFLCDAKGYVGL